MQSDLRPNSAPPPTQGRGFGLGTLLLVGGLSAAAASAFVLLLSAGPEAPSDPTATTPADTEFYQCPMHPSIIREHPGDCPICGMKLIKLARQEEGAADDQKKKKKKLLFYRSPMDPQQTSPTPRQDEMGMDYLPVYEGELGGASTVPGSATVEIDASRQQLIGLKTAEATRGSIGGAWRTVGRVAIDETRVRHINLKVPGFVERIYVDFIGKQVNRGDPLFSLYSPELLSTQEEYLLALRTQAALAGAGGRSQSDGDALVQAARRKLTLWDVPESELKRISETGQPTKTLTFYSPVSGVVTKKDVVEGMKLDAGAMPYEIVDLSTVWVLADVYESELRFVKKDMAAVLKLNAFPNREFHGKVAFVDPLLDPTTRTVTVRITLPNPDGELRPEMIGEVVLSGVPHQGLRIPPDAIIDSGTNKLVFVAIGEGKFQPRIVKIGDSDDAQAEVLEGLSAGERVVIRANFLVDSESRLRASLIEITSGPDDSPESARVLPPGPEFKTITPEPPPSAEPSSRPAAGPGATP